MEHNLIEKNVGKAETEGILAETGDRRDNGKRAGEKGEIWRILGHRFIAF